MVTVYGEKRRVVCFSLDKERDLYDFCSELNFSAFVKRCLVAELQRRKAMARGAAVTVNLGEGEPS